MLPGCRFDEKAEGKFLCHFNGIEYDGVWFSVLGASHLTGYSVKQVEDYLQKFPLDEGSREGWMTPTKFQMIMCKAKSEGYLMAMFTYELTNVTATPTDFINKLS